jgi:hypothetical protein
MESGLTRVRVAPCSTFQHAGPAGRFTMENRCLTVCAPFAHLITTGAKSIENRPRRASYRGRVLIHAGVKRSYGGHSAAYWANLFDVDSADLTYGAIVGAVDLVDCVPVGSLAVPASPHAAGPWCWILANPRRLAEPVRLSGNLGLFRLDPFTLARVDEQLTFVRGLVTRPFKITEVSSC